VGVPHARPAGLPLAAALAAALLAGCAGPAASIPDPGDLSSFDLQARLAARGASWVGHRGEFRVGGERFNGDCTGFVEAVYEAEGIPLRALMRRAAPDERGGVAAAFRAVKSYGVVFGGGEWPAAGDLVFWHDTYDRNGNGRADDPFTHIGIVEYVVDGTVVFVHRGGKGVARGAMNPERPREEAADGVRLNSAIRARNPRLEGVPALAGALFAGYGRVDPRRVPRGTELAAR
jgi:hypothetical protein